MSSAEINMSTAEEEIDIESLYQSISPQAPQAPSIAEWLVPIFDHAKSMKYLHKILEKTHTDSLLRKNY